MTPDVSVSTVWETLKVYLRDQIIPFMANKKRSSLYAQLKLDEEIAKLDKRYAQYPSLDLNEKRLKLKTEYDLIMSHLIENLL